MQKDQIVETTVAGFPALQVDGSTKRPPLLFIHGSFVDHLHFRPWMEFFAGRGWSSVAPARRGRAGIGPERARGLSISDYLQDTLAVIRALDRKPIVVGHSLGGLIAQKLMELGEVEAGVLLAPAPAAKLPAQAVALPVYLPMMPKILTGRPMMPGPNGCPTIALNRVPEADRPKFHRTLVHESGKVYREMIFGTYKVDFAKVRCPVFVGGGRHDRIVAADLVEWTAKQLGVLAHIYEENAHWLLGEPGWEKIASDVAGWLDGLFATERPPLRRIA